MIVINDFMFAVAISFTSSNFSMLRNIWQSKHYRMLRVVLMMAIIYKLVYTQPITLSLIACHCHEKNDRCT